jgi:hypothetical protein
MPVIDSSGSRARRETKTIRCAYYRLMCSRPPEYDDAADEYLQLSLVVEISSGYCSGGRRLAIYQVILK